MPSTFSEWCLGRLLLLLLLGTSVSGGSPADPAMTTQDSSQTQVNSVTKMQPGHESSDIATQELKPASKEDSEYEIVLSGAPVEKNISVASPTKVELICKLGEDSNLKNPQVTWKKGGETISHTTKTQNSWSIQVTISESSQLGSYTCILKGEKELSATFHLHVPKTEGREKPVITYIGDTAVMVCKTEYNAKAWTWYMTNGTELAPINTILPTDKFEIMRKSAKVSRLEIFKLTKKDRGVYWCEAVFDLGSSKSRFELKVLSISAPLKPFIAVVAEVAILVTTIVLYEVYSKRKGKVNQKKTLLGDRSSSRQRSKPQKVSKSFLERRFKPREVEIISKLQKMYATMHFKHSLCFEVLYI
ncbi:embigin isoform X2 [Parus major]|uniref:embigin isoform X2 n=1 Tax=Parus major TaxID=9157 RepID=UPI00077103C1|nr:embigin isoform X2 [Parus major]